MASFTSFRLSPHQFLSFSINASLFWPSELAYIRKFISDGWLLVGLGWGTMGGHGGGVFLDHM
jgi:hypothetical protein